MSYSISWHTLLGPWNVKYPTNFYDGGDSAAQIFEKHIQEIIRIYGLLNALDEGKLDIGDFERAMDAHINDSDPHPNLKLVTPRGNLPTSRIDGLEALIQGMIDSALSSLSSETPEHNSLNGLQGGGGGNYYHLSKEQYDALGSGGGGGGGETPTPSVDFEAGSNYLKIGNVLFQWGRGTIRNDRPITLPKPYSSTPLLVSSIEGAHHAHTTDQPAGDSVSAVEFSMWATMADSSTITLVGPPAGYSGYGGILSYLTIGTV